MEEILNKQYIRKNSINSDIFIPNKIDGDKIHFTNGALGAVSTFMEEFELYQQSINESSSMELDPKKFFEAPLAESAVQDILKTTEALLKNPNVNTHESPYLKEIRNQSQEAQPSFLNYGNTSDEQQNFMPPLTDEEFEAQTNDVQVNVQNAPKVRPENRLPEYDVFDRVKKSEEIEILIPFTIKLPRAEKLDALNDMFETSFSEYLAKQYIAENVVNNSVAIRKQIKNSIEEWMENEIYGTKGRKKPRKIKEVKKPMKRSPKAEEIETPTDIASFESIPEDDISTFFGASKKSWDGNLKKLFVITTEEQFLAVEKEYNRLKENDQFTVDYDKYEDMILAYKDMIATSQVVEKDEIITEEEQDDNR